MFGDDKQTYMGVEKVLFTNPFFHIALLERNGKWSAEIGNCVYHWNCNSKEEVIEKTIEQVNKINENETRHFFQKHFAFSR